MEGEGKRNDYNGESIEWSAFNSCDWIGFLQRGLRELYCLDNVPWRTL